ncbi:MAG: hypothetical protein CM15mP68_5490 [Pseudomonadota bacterium]|nr:MAG: hypothetical protein CM15mP68_5490 [Pseudomonadota bacterium]
MTKAPDDQAVDEKPTTFLEHIVELALRILRSLSFCGFVVLTDLLLCRAIIYWVAEPLMSRLPKAPA